MSKRSLNLLVLGPGKTGSLVAEVARERGHQVKTIDADVNQNAAWLTSENLRDVDVAIDFTAPDAVLANIEACTRARKAMVVGTTGWYGEMERIRHAVEQAENRLRVRRKLFLRRESVPSDRASCGTRPEAQLQRTHHRNPSYPQERRAVGYSLNIATCAGTSVRSNTRYHFRTRRRGCRRAYARAQFSRDRIVLTHEAKSRRTFAEGAVLAAEWIAGKTGFYEFKDIFAQL